MEHSTTAPGSIKIFSGEITWFEADIGALFLFLVIRSKSCAKTVALLMNKSVTAFDELNLVLNSTAV